LGWDRKTRRAKLTIFGEERLAAGKESKKRYIMSSWKKSIVFWAVVGVVFIACPVFAWILYFQLDYDSNNPLYVGGDYIKAGERLSDNCDLTGYPLTLTLLLKNSATSTYTLSFSNPYLNYSEWWFFSKEINTNNQILPVIFDLSSSTPIDLSQCDVNAGTRWQFALQRTDTPFYIYGSYNENYPKGKCIPEGQCVNMKDLYFVLEGDLSATSTLPEQPAISEICNDLGTISGAFCQVITYLFYPNNATLTQFSNLKDIIATKPPFGYWTSIKGYLNNLSSTSTPAFTLTAEIGNIGIFNTLKTGLVWVLWLFFGFWVIKRIARFEF
jgi:hypothetical protein